jgi:hypothetical protein
MGAAGGGGMFADIIAPVHDAVGIALIMAGSLVGLAAALVLRTRAPAPVETAVLAACGLAVGTGALLVQDHDVSRTNWVLTLVLTPVLIPAHVRIVLGRFGPRSSE